MAAPQTTRVEFDTGLLERLRARRPERSDRELLESVARIQLGREASARVKERFEGVPSKEIEREAVAAVGEAAGAAVVDGRRHAEASMGRWNARRGGRMSPMTAKEQLRESLPRVTESQAEAALRVIESQIELAEHFKEESKMSAEELAAREDRRAEVNAREMIREEPW